MICNLLANTTGHIQNKLYVTKHFGKTLYNYIMQDQWPHGKVILVRDQYKMNAIYMSFTFIGVSVLLLIARTCILLPDIIY